MSIDYQYAVAQMIDNDGLLQEISDAGLYAPVGYSVMYSTVNDNFDLTLTYDPPLADAAKVTLDGVVASHEGNTLKLLKVARYAEIDAKTRDLISQGFVHDSTTFSLSANAQRNWNNLKIAVDAGWVTYPYKVSTKADSEYSLADASAADALVQAASDKVRDRVDSGRTLKVQIANATTVEAVNAIVDDRT